MKFLHFLAIFTQSAPRPIQSISRHFRLLFVVVPSWKQRFLVDWRPLVKERIANIGILEDGLTFDCLDD